MDLLHNHWHPLPHIEIHLIYTKKISRFVEKEVTKLVNWTFVCKKFMRLNNR